MSIAEMISLALKSFERSKLRGFFDDFVSAVNELMGRLIKHGASRDLIEFSNSFALKMAYLKFRKNI